MDILFLPHDFGDEISPSGGSYHVDQAEALSNRGSVVTAAFIRFRSFRTWNKGKWFCYFGNTVSGKKRSIPFTEMRFWNPGSGVLRHVIRKAFYPFLLKRHLKMHPHPDVVHIHFGPWTGLAIEAIKAVFPGVPIILTEHSSDVGMKRLVGRELKMLREIYLKVDVLTAVSGHLASEVEAICGKRPSVIPNFIERPPEVRETGTATRRAISIGKLTKIKRHQDAIDAFSKLPKDFSMSLDIYGEGPEKARLRAYVKETGLSNITFHGSVPTAQIYRELSNSDMLIHCSEYETFGCVFMEAMAVGVPVVAADSLGAKGLIASEIGMIYPVGDSDQLAKQIVEVEEGLVKYSPESIRGYFEANYSAEVVCETWEKLYADVVDEARNLTV